MNGVLKLSILTPDKNFYSGEVTKISTDSTSGGIEILDRHMSMITMLRPSATTFKDINGGLYKAFISSGILKVKNHEVEILCDAAEWPDEIKRERAEAAKERAEKRLSNKENIDVKRAEMALYRSLIRLRVKGL